MTVSAVKALKAHVAIQVANVQRSVEFYRRMFGVGPSKVRPGYAKFDLANPPLNFTLNETPSPERGGLSHLGIQVGSTEEVLAVRERWMEQGLVPRDEMGTQCCYALQDKSWVRDPDGNEWEVFVVLQDDTAALQGEGALQNRLPGKSAAEACCAPTCCAPAGAK